MPHDLPPWQVAYQQSQRWIKAGVFESLAHDLRAVLRIAEGRKESPTAAIIDSRKEKYKYENQNERQGWHCHTEPQPDGNSRPEGQERRQSGVAHSSASTARPEAVIEVRNSKAGRLLLRDARLLPLYSEPRFPQPLGGIHGIPIGELNTAYYIHHALNGWPRRCFRGLIEGGITL